MNLIFNIKLPRNFPHYNIESWEKDLEGVIHLFKWVTQKEMEGLEIYPEFLKEDFKKSPNMMSSQEVIYYSEVR